MDDESGRTATAIRQCHRTKLRRRGWIHWVATSIGVCIILSVGVCDLKADPGRSGKQAVPRKAAQFQRENREVLIDGIHPGERDTSPYPQGLSIILRYLGHKDAEYTRMMGYSGMAFVLQMDLSGPIRDGKYDVAWWPNDCWAFDMRLPFMAKAFGRELAKNFGDPTRFPKDCKGQYCALFEPAVIASIGKGRPLLGQRDAARIITGYDKPNRQAIGIWPTPGQPAFGDNESEYPWGLIVPGNAIKAMPRRKAEIESLRWAVSLGEDTAVSSVPAVRLARPDIKTNPATVLLTGKKAYAKWLEMLADDTGLGRDAWDQNIIIHLRYNRAAAVAYLRDVASRQSAATAVHLRAAAILYLQVLDATTSAPFWSQDDSPDLRVAKKREYTEMVGRIAKLEVGAIAEMRQAVRAAK